MAEKTSGIYKLVTMPKFYASFQSLLGGDEVRDRVKQEHFPDLSGKRILEVGCGPGIWVPWLSECESYLGLDWNKKHIRNAQEKWPSDKFKFEARDVRSLSENNVEEFDLVIAFGLIHHLSDVETSNLLSTIAQVLKEDGSLITIDPVFHENQNIIARIMKHLDSGKHIRQMGQYEKLVPEIFTKVEVQMTKDLLRIPYSHCFMTCSKQPTSE